MRHDATTYPPRFVSYAEREQPNRHKLRDPESGRRTYPRPFEALSKPRKLAPKES